MTERLHCHFSLSCVGEGNGNPFQCSCLENPRDGGAWWADVYGAAQSQIRLKQFSSSSSQYSCLENSTDRACLGYSPRGREESDTTEQLRFHFSLSCIGEGNGNPFQCSCLENPRDRGAWWAAIYGVAQSWTRLKRLSSRSSIY